MKEIWRPVVEYESRYEVSSYGRIRTISRLGFHPKNKHGKLHLFKIGVKIKSQHLDRYGYFRVSLRGDDGINHTTLAHTHVAKAFVNGYKPGLQVNHKNSIKTDNIPENLEWCSAAHNTRHRKSNKLSEACVLKIRKLINRGTPYKHIGSLFDISESHIRRIKLGICWAAQ